MVRTLDAREREVLRLVYREGKLLSEVGAMLGMSGERVRQIQASALRRVSERMARSPQLCEV